MLIYLADLVHNYFPGLNTVPLNIAYIAAYSKSLFNAEVEFRLFKYPEELLDAIDKETPSLVGLSNYVWNYRLNAFVGGCIKEKNPRLPVVMGGPNIRCDSDGIASFLKANDYVDVYCMFEGELPFSRIVGVLLKQPVAKRDAQSLRNTELDSCFSFASGKLNGGYALTEDTASEYIAYPPPYVNGFLDKFLESDLIPLFETNRGCPYTCSYCNWGASVRKKLKQFSLDQVKAEINYVVKKGIKFPYWTIVDANFGILKRDVQTAYFLREIYEKYKPFGVLEMYWDKQWNPHMIEIAKILRGLSNAYIAFQSFDPEVQKMIKRKNISMDKLTEISKDLAVYSKRLHTDILLGLPGETTESHLNSLRTAFNLGFDSIGGGEVRLLSGSDLETDDSRRQFGLKTKFRLGPEGFGLYKGNFVFELEEGIRSTNWISEEEMIRLRVLRAIFYISISTGEYLPLMQYLKSCDVDVISLFQRMIETKKDDPLVNESIDWLIDKANREWFDSIDDAENFFKDQENQKKLLRSPVVKLNFDFHSYLLLSVKKYNAFKEHIFKNIKDISSLPNPKIIHEILTLCEKRNYLFSCLQGKYENKVSMKLSLETVGVLERIRYIPEAMPESNGAIEIAMQDSNARFIKDYIKEAGENLYIQTVSMAIQKAHEIYMEPVLECNITEKVKA